MRKGRKVAPVRSNYVPSTPRMVTGEVEMVSVLWIMQNLQNSVDGFGMDAGGSGCWVDFERMIARKGADRHMGRLINTITKNGFRVPIVLVKEYVPYFTQSPRGLTLGNGHHRMVAAILMCLDEIPVYWSEGDEYMCGHTSDTESILDDAGDYEDLHELIRSNS